MSAIKAESPTLTALPWKDCECGCHGSALSVGSLHFWFITFPRESKPFELRNGHGLSAGQKLGVFVSVQEMDTVVFGLAKPALEQEQKQKQIAAFLALGGEVSPPASAKQQPNEPDDLRGPGPCGTMY